MFPFLQLLLSGVSTGLSIFGGMNQAKGEKKQSAALEAEEAIRNKQMQLDFQRTRIEAVRSAAITSSMATAAAANQGGLQSSSFKSGKSAIANQENYQLEGIQQNLDLGNQIFKARTDYYNAGGQISFGQGQSNLGNQIAGNIDNLSRIGGFALGTLSSLGKSSNQSGEPSTAPPADQAMTIGYI